MKTVEIHYIEFITDAEAANIDNYPHDGLFISKTKNGMSDLRYIHKECTINNCIAPADIAKKVLNIVDSVVVKEIEQELTNKYDGDFILEFARILLNRK